MRRPAISSAQCFLTVSLLAIGCAPVSQTSETSARTSPANTRSVQVIDKADGEALYVRYCASCHGMEGRGDGRVAAYLRGGVPDLTRLAGIDQPFPVDRVIDAIRGSGAEAHGTPRMPVWGPGLMGAPDDWPEAQQEAFFSNRLARLAEYLESIQDGDGR